MSLNGALMPFTGMAAFCIPVLAKVLFLNPFAAPFLAGMRRDSGAMSRLIEGLGRHCPTRKRIIMASAAHQRHIAAAVGMMANWDLHELKQAYIGSKRR